MNLLLQLQNKQTKHMNLFTTILNLLIGTRVKPKAGPGRPSKYPWTTTPIGGSFMMKNGYGAPTLKKLRALGLQYKQHKTAKGVLATRIG